ncbi:hypothetical protein P4O66_022581 [Electrophorus voltai]|uniref:MAGE domain-containing protein n=1 Tax=Electrophorus voltai TaxID=2609070 RepID=A0AAD9E4G6_9TELE|nr:hypothetical protein P4O66_022581 [Electrophorus voltai]
MSQRSAGSGARRRRPGRSQVILDDDEPDVSSQPSSSQVQRARCSFTPQQIEQKVAEVVQFILIKDQKKIPIRRADVVKHVVKEYKGQYPGIIRRAGQTFEQVFGLNLVEIDSKNHVYILVNKLHPLPGEPISMCPGSPKTGLLFVILSLIFMKGGTVKEILVWNTLKKLRVYEGVKHEEFGDVKKLVTDVFVRQKYLEYVRIPHTEPLEHEFRWGARAEQEVSKMKLLQFIGELHNEEPQTWTQQYREAASVESNPR